MLSDNLLEFPDSYVRIDVQLNEARSINQVGVKFRGVGGYIILDGYSVQVFSSL